MTEEQWAEGLQTLLTCDECTWERYAPVGSTVTTRTTRAGNHWHTINFPPSPSAGCTCNATNRVLNGVYTMGCPRHDPLANGRWWSP